ncbi:MAG: SIS domain-containing protein [Aerococcus sp.]|nr:SIS domain-containing protein [Aerococcus sp.]
MFTESDEKLKELGADITVREVQQQPELWQEAYDNYVEQREKITEFLNAITAKHDRIRVVFAGAGTSAFVGETIVPHLAEVNDQKKWEFRAVATTDIVGTPEKFLQHDIPTILVSFARSGNSPESVATVEIAEQLVDDLYQMTITCAPDGKLAQKAEKESDNLLLLQPAGSNDKGFAMTGSYSCMALTALLVFDTASEADKKHYVETIIEAGHSIIEREEDIQAVANLDFERVIYLGSGGFFGLSRETQLKILELTAGKIATQYETPIGFRHGPKSLVDEKTVVMTYVSNNAYTDLYDADLVNEVYHDEIAEKVLALTAEKRDKIDADQFVVAHGTESLPDVYLSFPYVMFGQTFAVMTAIKIGNTPDTPSPSGTVNRVVQGVIIHPLGEEA